LVFNSEREEEREKNKLVEEAEFAKRDMIALRNKLDGIREKISSKIANIKDLKVS